MQLRVSIRLALTAGVAACIALPRLAHAEIYRWVDAEGREHYTQSIDQAPAAQRESARIGAQRRPPLNPAETRAVKLRKDRSDRDWRPQKSAGRGSRLPDYAIEALASGADTWRKTPRQMQTVITP